MTHSLQIAGMTLPCRMVEVDGLTYMVPRGVARNNRNRSWQVKIKRQGVLQASGNFTDDCYGQTSEALREAIKYMASTGAVKTSKTIKISSLITLSWTTVGKGVVGVSANVYNPNTMKGLTIYLISQKKLAAGKTEGLASKLVRAFMKEIEYKTGREPASVDTCLEIAEDVQELLKSEAWEDFKSKGVLV